MRKLDLVFIIYIFLIFSCTEETNLPSLIEHKIKNYERVVFIPHQGCIGCSREALELLENYDKYPKTLFVVTKIAELRAAKIELNRSINLIKATNVLIDEENDIVSNIDIDIYPIIYRIEGEKLILVKEAKNGIHQYLN